MVVVPLNARHAPAELCYALEDAGVRVLFSEVEVPGLPSCVEHVFDMHSGYEELLAGAPEQAFVNADENELAGLFYTGGTTGKSKGVMLTHRNLIANANHFQWVWPFDAGTCWLVAAPLFHAAGSLAVLGTVWQAGHHVMLPVFDPVDALELIADHGVTHTLLVPTMLAAVTEEQLGRHRDRPPRPRGVPRSGADACLWRHRNGAACHRDAARGTVAGRSVRPFLRPAHPRCGDRTARLVRRARRAR
jgi:long-chain acyl-CoA synthetase